MNHEVIELRNMRMRRIETVAKQSQACNEIEDGLRNYGLVATQENIDAVVEIMRKENKKMIKVYYFIKGEEEGTLYKEDMTEREYEQFMENMGSAIEIFEIRESYRL